MNMYEHKSNNKLDSQRHSHSKVNLQNKLTSICSRFSKKNEAFHSDTPQCLIVVPHKTYSTKETMLIFLRVNASVSKNMF